MFDTKLSRESPRTKLLVAAVLGALAGLAGTAALLGSIEFAVFGAIAGAVGGAIAAASYLERSRL